jgi:hypothetical protein
VQHLYHLISAMHYPHWMMIGGGVLMVVGFIGFALKRNAETKDPEIMAAAPIKDSHE